GELVAGDVAHRAAIEAAPRTGEDFYRLRAAPDLLPHHLAQILGAVGEQVDARCGVAFPPQLAVVQIRGGADMVAAGANTRPGHDRLGNRQLERRIDVVRAARADVASETT